MRERGSMREREGLEEWKRGWEERINLHKDCRVAITLFSPDEWLKAILPFLCLCICCRKKERSTCHGNVLCHSRLTHAAQNLNRIPAIHRMIVSGVDTYGVCVCVCVSAENWSNTFLFDLHRPTTIYELAKCVSITCSKMIYEFHFRTYTIPVYVDPSI